MSRLLTINQRLERLLAKRSRERRVERHPQCSKLINGRQCLRKGVIDGRCTQHAEMYAKMRARSSMAEPAAHNGEVASSTPAGRTIPDMLLLALPAPRQRVARAEVVTPPVIYLPGPVAPAQPSVRDILDLRPKLPPPPERYYPTRGERQAYQMPHGSPEQIARLEYCRRIQEDAWYSVGYSRDEIIRMMDGWPTKLGYPAYEWRVGYPPVGWTPRHR